MKLTGEKFEMLRKELDELYDHFNTHNPEQIGIQFRGTTAEACIFTNADREIVEQNAMLRMQFNRIEQEHQAMCKLLDMFTMTLVGKVVQETEEVKS